jgi:hypothetical protein
VLEFLFTAFTLYPLSAYANAKARESGMSLLSASAKIACVTFLSPVI